ncbi:ankyrin repeat-containing domain protein [Mariannaea sp. PMI_226]|nr:ankyrin repeat-containing domain protein [Mariannaea sp. PMI_226]
MTPDSFTPLLLACMLPSGATDLVATLLAAGADPRIHDHLREPGPLYEATLHGHTDIIEQLLASKNCPNIDACGNHFSTPLGIAVQTGQTAVIELLINKGANVNASYRNGSTALYDAVDRGDVQIVPVQILDREARGKMGGGTALYQACLAGHFKCARHLIQRGSSLTACFGKRGLSSILQAAAVGGNAKLIQYLLKKHAFNINEMNGDCLTPLALACWEENRCAATILVRNGADPTLKCLLSGCGRYSALYWCAQSFWSSTGIARLLLRYQSTAWSFSQEDLDLGLTESVEMGCEGMCQLLLEHGANPNYIPEGEDWGCLHKAVAEGHVRILEILLSDPRTNTLHTDAMGQTAFHVACSGDLISVIIPFIFGSSRNMALFNAGQLLSVKDIYGRLALDLRSPPGMSQTPEKERRKTEIYHLTLLQKLLDPSARYVNGDFDYSQIGDCLLSMGEDERAVRAYQMELKWEQWENKVNFFYDYQCDGCGSNPIENSSRMVC